MPLSVRCWRDADGDDERGGFGVDDRDQAENQQSVGLQDEKEGDAGLCGLSGRPLTMEGAHQHPEVEAGDMDQIALVDVLTSAQPSSPHAAAIEDVGERPLDESPRAISTKSGLRRASRRPCDVATDKGYHSREQVKALADGVWKTRIAEPEPAKGYLRWHGDKTARRAVYANRARLKSGIGREIMRRRGEMVERSFAHILDRGGMRRAWLHGRENIHKRYLIHVAGFNLGVLMRALHGQGTPREAADARAAFILVWQIERLLVFGVIAVIDAKPAALVVTIALAPTET